MLTMFLLLELLMASIRGGIHAIALCVVSIAGLFIHLFRKENAIYGPFTSAERTAQVWFMAAFVCTMSHVADADSMNNECVRTVHLFAVLLGALIAYIIMSYFMYYMNKLKPVNSAQWRKCLYEIAYIILVLIVPALSFGVYFLRQYPYLMNTLHSYASDIVAGRYWGFIPPSTGTWLQ